MKYEKEILKILEESDNYITSEIIASSLNISKRTVTSVIKAINSTDLIILSTNKGYKLNKMYKPKQTNIELPNEREDYIIWSLLTKKSVSIYDIADELSVSSSTIRKDISNLKNTLFTNFSLKINSSRDILYLYGSEDDIRKLFDWRIRKESKDRFTTINFLQSCFPYIDVIQLKVIVHSILQKQEIFVHDFQLISIILHLCIIIQRTKDNNKMFNEDYNFSGTDVAESNAAKKILDKVSIIYPQCHFDNSEIMSFSLILASNSTKIYSSTIIDNYVNKDIIKLTDKIINNVQSSFKIDLSNQSFRSKFMIHLDNLVNRLKNNITSKNDLISMTKSQFSLVYEIASSISYIIKEEYGTDVPDEETCFIAFHIGNEIDEQMQNESLIKCAVIAPDYQQMHYHLANKLTALFATKLIIVSIESVTLEKYAFNNIDLVISTNEIDSDVPSIIVHPFLASIDIDRIDKKIKILIDRKKNKSLRKNLLHIFNKNFFCQNKQFSNEKDAISYMCNTLYKHKFVTKDFEQQVINREKHSSTAFGNYSIPHSLVFCSLKTTIFVLINETPIKWNNSYVNFVFLICVNKDEADSFRDLFSSICNIMQNEKIKQQLLKVNDFNDFIKTLKIYI